MGSRKKPPEAPQLPPIPPPPEIMDFIDEINGTQTITVTQHGKKKRITQALPMTAEEQAILDRAKNLVTTSMRNIEQLYQYDPNLVANYQPFIQAFANINQERMQDLSRIGDFSDIGRKVEQFRAMNRELANRAFDTQQRRLETDLARRGLGRSSEAAEQRAAFARERGLLEQQSGINAEMYGEDLISRQLAREGDIYNLREAGRAGRLQEAQAGYELEKQRLADQEALRQQALAENQALMQTGQNVLASQRDKANLALQGAALASNTQANQAANQMQRYQGDLSRIQNQYQMQLAAFNNRPASFGRQLGNLAMGTAGAFFGGPIGGAIGSGAGSALFGGGASQTPSFGGMLNQVGGFFRNRNPAGPAQRRAAFNDLQNLGQT